MSFESPELKQQIREELAVGYDAYTVNATTRSKQANKTFTGLSGPFGIGKSTLSDEILRIEPSIKPIHTTTTRHRKPEDPAGFKTADEGVTFTSMLSAVKHGELVNYSMIPYGDIYGTYPEDFPAQHTIGPFLPTSIDQISRAGFEAYHFVYIVTAGDLWRGYVEATRRHLPAQTFQNRVDEALDSIEFALDNPQLLHFIENRHGEAGMHTSAQQIARIALNQSDESLDDTVAMNYLRQMHTVAQELKAA